MVLHRVIAKAFSPYNMEIDGFENKDIKKRSLRVCRKQKSQDKAQMSCRIFYDKLLAGANNSWAGEEIVSLQETGWVWGWQG